MSRSLHEGGRGAGQSSPPRCPTEKGGNKMDFVGGSLLLVFALFSSALVMWIKSCMGVTSTHQKQSRKYEKMVISGLGTPWKGKESLCGTNTTNPQHSQLLPRQKLSRLAPLYLSISPVSFISFHHLTLCSLCPKS